MKRTIRYKAGKRYKERTINYIPVRYIIAFSLTILEVLLVIGMVVALCIFVPYFYLAALATQIVVVIKIVASDANPDYKVPWLLFVLILPVVGFMLYFLFSSRKVNRKYVKRLGELKSLGYEQEDGSAFESLRVENPVACAQAKMLAKIADSHLFTNTKTQYFPLGEDLFEGMLADLNRAERFIFMEYFIIEEGKFWNTILEILEKKAKQGVVVKVVYDDIGCMSTLPGNYAKKLREKGIDGTPFSRLRGNADSEFNNRNHRKITVIDGVIAYTGGVNIADEYINETIRFGHWKDIGLRLEGPAVKELTQLFLIDYGINVKQPVFPENLYPETDARSSGYTIPFGDGPAPLYERRVGKSLLQAMLSSATRYAYITTPYLIIDNDLCTSLENAALRGVDVRIILPHIPDKKIVFGMTRSFYPRLMNAGVRIFEYESGFVHAKSYLIDDDTAMIGTLNLDYRSLVHHFENGVWMYKTDCLQDLKRDIEETLGKCIEITPEMQKAGPFRRAFRSIVRIFAPLL